MENHNKKGKGLPEKPTDAGKAKADPETAKIINEVAPTAKTTGKGKKKDQLCAECLENAKALIAVQPEFTLEKIQNFCKDHGHEKTHKEMPELIAKYTAIKDAEKAKAAMVETASGGQVAVQEVQRRNIAPLLASGQQNWITPPDLFNALNAVFHFELDPCTTSANPLGTKYLLTKEQDGLAQPWYYDAFVNSPFSEIKTDSEGKPRINKKGKIIQSTIVHKWVEKSAKEHKANGITVVQIMANRTETDAAQVYGFPNMRAVCFLNKRVAFIDPDNNMQKLSPTFGSMLLIFKKDPFTKEQLDLLNSIGKLLALYQQD